jgi:predicted nucleotidyltransferase
MLKPGVASGYDPEVTEACERVLVTLLRSLGPWRDSIFLVGGLTPRYLIKARPPEANPHAGTGDLDLVVDFAILNDIEAYRTLEDNLKAIGFERAENGNGAKLAWRWKTTLENGVTMVVEFLADNAELSGGKVMELPTDGNVSALNIPHASMVFDHHETLEITADLLDGQGRTTETVRYADIVSFTCLKAFAFDHRAEPKDAHDLVYCLENLEGGLEAARSAFLAALKGQHAEVVRQALQLLKGRFLDPDADQSYRRNGPVAVALFEIEGDPDQEDGLRDRRVLRQRLVADLMTAFLADLPPV